jgi:hypothetical protein
MVGCFSAREFFVKRCLRFLILTFSICQALHVSAPAPASAQTPETLQAVYDWSLKRLYPRRFYEIEYVPEPPESPALRSVTTRFGPAVIDLKSLPYSSPVRDSGVRAWSSWWFPKRDRDFTTPKGEDFSILYKFDLVYENISNTFSAWKWESEHEAASPANWEGLCDGWALASILYPEPQKPQKFTVRDSKGKQREITFSVFDLKGLVIKTFEAVPEDQFDFYGERFRATADAYMHPDLYPEEFHRLVEVYLGERRQAFVMDRDPGIEVWSIPVYKANYIVDRVAGQRNMVYVRMFLYTAGAHLTVDTDATSNKEVIRDYHYVLSGDLDWTGTKLTVRKGAWIKGPNGVDSRVNHPDFIFAPKSSAGVKRLSYNPFVRPQRVDAIVKGGR